MFVFWLICVALTFSFYLKIIQWQTISRLGFLSEAPAAYIQKGRLYHYFGYLLLTFCMIWAFFISSWLVPLVIVGWLMVEVFGRSKGIKIYRSIIRELMATSQNGSEVEKFKKELAKTDLEIWKLARKIS